MALVGLPLSGWLLSLAVRVTQTGALTNANLLSVIGDPLGLLLVFGSLVLFTVAVFLDVATIAAVVHLQQTSRDVTWANLRGVLGRTLRRLVSPQAPLLMVYLALVVPLVAFGVTSTLTTRIRIPNFVTGELLKTPSGTAAYAGVMALLFFLNLRLLYVVPLLVVTEQSIWGCVRESWRLTGLRAEGDRGSVGRALKAVGLLALIVAAVGLAVSLFAVLVLAIGAGLERWLGRQALWPLGVLLAVAQVALMVGPVLASVTFMHDLLLRRRLIEGLDTHEPGGEPIRLLRGLRRVLVGLTVAGLLLVNIVYLGYIKLESQAWVIAHRGLTDAAVENTIEAVEAAAVHKPTYVEIDIQQTADGQFVVAHDVNLRRLAGDNRRISDLTLAEVTQVVQTQNGHTAKVPSLEAMLERANQLKQPLLIEIKPTGRETPDYLDRFFAQLQKHDAVGTHAMHSLDQVVVETLEEKHPELNTGFIVPIQVTGLVDVRADFLVLEEDAFSGAALERAHARGQKVVVWTVNEQQAMRKFLIDGADGVISDPLPLLVETRAGLPNDTSFFNKALDLVMPD
ncbi:glycerophosphodiester phosphodiesterase [Mariniluteicoccus flavus]